MWLTRIVAVVALVAALPALPAELSAQSSLFGVRLAVGHEVRDHVHQKAEHPARTCHEHAHQRIEMSELSPTMNL